MESEVIGSHPRMGAITAAVGLTCWLLSAGATACYIEDNPSGHLALLADVYQMAPVDRDYLCRGAPFLTGAAPEANKQAYLDIVKTYLAGV